MNKDDLDSDECLQLCMSVPNAKGCEWQDNGKCAVYKGEVTSSNGNGEYRCFVFKDCKG